MESHRSAPRTDSDPDTLEALEAYGDAELGSWLLAEEGHAPDSPPALAMLSEPLTAEARAALAKGSWLARIVGASRRGSSVQMLILFLAVCLGSLFFAGRELLDLAGVTHAAEPLVRSPRSGADPGPGERAASAGSQFGPALDRLSSLRAAAQLERWAVFASDGLCIAGEASVAGSAAKLGSSAEGDTTGHVGSNGGILLLGNASVHGDASPGPEAKVELRSGARITGSTEALERRLELPSILVPELRASGPLVVDPDNALTLETGDLAFSEVEIRAGATLRIHGPARLVVGSLRLGRDGRLEVDSAAGPVELYVIGNFVLGSAAELGSLENDPADLTILLCADNVHAAGRTIDFTAGLEGAAARIHAGIYAPRARVTLDGSLELFGSLVARIVRLDDQARVRH